jgi:hypothetical protein
MRRAIILLALFAFACGRSEASVQLKAVPAVFELPTASLRAIPIDPPSDRPGALVESTELARARVRQLLTSVQGLPGSTDMAARLQIADRQLEEALGHLEKAQQPSRRAETSARRALLSLRAVPLSLSLFAMDVPFAVRWHHLPNEVAEKLDREARSLRSMIERTSEEAERTFPSS